MTDDMIMNWLYYIDSRTFTVYSDDNSLVRVLSELGLVVVVSKGIYELSNDGKLFLDISKL